MTSNTEPTFVIADNFTVTTDNDGKPTSLFMVVPPDKIKVCLADGRSWPEADVVLLADPKTGITKSVTLRETGEIVWSANDGHE